MTDDAADRAAHGRGPTRRQLVRGAVALGGALTIAPFPAGPVGGAEAAGPAGHPTLRHGSPERAGLLPAHLRQLVTEAETFLCPSPRHPWYADAVLLAGRGGTVALHRPIGMAVRYQAYDERPACAAPCGGTPNPGRTPPFWRPRRTGAARGSRSRSRRRAMARILRSIRPVRSPGGRAAAGTGSRRTSRPPVGSRCAGATRPTGCTSGAARTWTGCAFRRRTASCSTRRVRRTGGASRRTAGPPPRTDGSGGHVRALRTEDRQQRSTAGMRA